MRTDPHAGGSRTPPGGAVELDSRKRVVITAYRDGPLLMRGPMRIETPDGSPLATRRCTVALCRCGKSRLAPFCDGTHKLVGFCTDEVENEAGTAQPVDAANATIVSIAGRRRRH